jgi:hypothetical protein
MSTFSNAQGGKRRIFSKVSSSSTHKHESTSTSHNRQAKTGQALLRVAAMQRCTVMQEERWVENRVVGGRQHTGRYTFEEKTKETTTGRKVKMKV